MSARKATKATPAAAERDPRDSDLGRIESIATESHSHGQAAFTAVGSEPAYEACEPKRERSRDAVVLDDFVGFMPAHSYIYTPTGQMWPASSVNTRIAPVLLVDEDGNPLRPIRLKRPAR